MSVDKAVYRRARSSAFPREEYKIEMRNGQPGMTLRDYFAAKAMQGMLAYPGGEGFGSHHSNNTFEGVASLACAYADALLTKLAEEQGGAL